MWTIKQNERNQSEGIKDKAEIDWSRENNKINNKTITWHLKKKGYFSTWKCINRWIWSGKVSFWPDMIHSL